MIGKARQSTGRWHETANTRRWTNGSQSVSGVPMSKCDFYEQAVEAIYASGADSGRVPDALAAISRLLGGRGATLEVIDKATQRPIEFHSVGLPSAAGARYFDHFAEL